MNIQEWTKKYTASAYVYKVDIENEHRAGQIIEDLKLALAGKKLVFYGAGTVGRVFYQLLKELGMPVEYAVDINLAEAVFPAEVRIYPPEYLVDHLDDDYLVIATVNRNLYQEVLNKIQELGIKTEAVVCGHEIHMVAQAAWCMLKACNNENIVLKNCYECTNLDNTCFSLNQYLRRKNGFVDKGLGTKEVRMIGYALGNICTLRCKNCCESVPYMPADIKKMVPKENVIKDIQHLSSACNFLTLLEFVGGEPFLHPDLPEILQNVLEIRNIGVIHIFTNGTVVPSDALCKALNNDRITVYISNYQASLPDSRLRAISQTDKKLKDYGINSFFGKKQNWMDFSGYELVNTEDELEKVFEACFLHNCNRLQDGKLYVCAHQYAGIMLGKLQDNGETISIHKYSSEELSRELERLKAFKKTNACLYCTMPFKAKTVLSGEQLTR